MWIGICLIAAVAASVVGIFAYRFDHAPQKIDKATNCPVDGPVSSTAVIIDTTDKINDIQKIAIENEFGLIQQSVPRFGALTVYTADFRGDVSKPMFFGCNPGHAKDIDWLIEGKAIAEKKWRDGFRAPLHKTLEAMLAANPAQATPLLEAIQSASVQSFGPLRAREGDTTKKQLILVSDLLQHSNNVSLYKSVPRIEVFLKSEAYRRVRSDLRGVDISILFIRRQTKKGIQGPALVRFWEELFTSAGGRVVGFKPLEG